MNVCVLGATGFIGGQIALAAVARGWTVRAARRNPASTGAIGDAAVAWVTAELGDAASLAAAMRDCDVVFHAAAAYPQDFRHIDREVRRARSEITRVLDAARDAGARRVVYTSSLSTLFPGPVGDAVPRTLDEASFYMPGSARSAYYEAKFAMERIALERRDMDVVVTLPTAVFGPGDVKPTTGVVIRDAARGLFPVYFDAVMNCVDGRDAARSHLAAAERGRPGERYILGGPNLTMLELLSAACAAAGRPPPRVRLSRSLFKALLRAADALPFVSLPENIRTFEMWHPVSSAKAEAELSHTARPFEDTVRDTLAWFRRGS